MPDDDSSDTPESLAARQATEAHRASYPVEAAYTPPGPYATTTSTVTDGTGNANQSHLRRILREYETCHNQHRPHRFLHGAAPLKPEPVNLDHYRVRRHAHVGGLINEYRLVA